MFIIEYIDHHIRTIHLYQTVNYAHNQIIFGCLNRSHSENIKIKKIEESIRFQVCMSVTQSVLQKSKYKYKYLFNYSS